MNDYRILVVDDEEDLCEILKFNLENEGYEVDTANSAEEAMKMDISSYHLILLDVMMGEISGFKMANILKKDKKTAKVPIIFITAKDTENDTVTGFNLGADDYLAKPFNPLEAVARVNSNIRRFYSLGTKVVQEGNLAVRDLVLNQDACTLKKGDKIIQLTSVEYRIMELLMKHPGKVFTKQQIYEHGWGEEYIVADNNIMVCISKLRAKLDDDPSAYIQTIRGLGYRLEK